MMEALAQIEKMATNLFSNHPMLGWMVALFIVLFNLFNFLTNLLPKLELWKSKILIPLAKKWKFKKLVKAAIKSDIKSNLNILVGDIQKELPAGWMKEVDIKWVEKENKDDFFDDECMVIRMKPLERQDDNFVKAIYYFFRKYSFPKTKRIIPEFIRESAVLYLCKRAIKKQRDSLTNTFNDTILEPVIEKKDSVLDNIEKFEKIDEKGFFTGTFLREIHEIANQIRFSQLRKNMGQESAEVLKHIDSFIEGINSDEKKISDDEWYRFGPVTSYSFLLVAHPLKTTGSIDPYINRTKEKSNRGAKRLYVFGSSKEKGFANKVISTIEESVSEYKLTERFELHQDYRGEKGGIGAIFVKK